MQQEFGSAVSGAPIMRVPSAPHVTTSSHVAGVAARPVPVIPSPAPIIATQEVAKAWEQKDQKDREFIGTVEGIGGVAMMPLMLDMGTALLSKVLTLGGLLDNTGYGARVNGTLRPWFRAARTTELRDIKNYGNRVLAKRVEFNARGELVNQKMIDKYDAIKGKLHQRPAEWKDSKFGSWFQEKMSNATSRGGLLKRLDDKVAEFARWRSKRLLASAQKNLLGNEAEFIKKFGSLEAVPADKVDGIIRDLDVRMGQGATHEPGFLSRTFARAKPQEYAVEYGDELIGKVRTLKTEADAKAFAKGIVQTKDMTREVAAKAKGKLPHINLLSTRQALGHAETAGHAAAGYAHIGDGKGSAIAKAMRALPKGLAKASLLHVAFGAGAALMVAAKFMDGGRENRLEGNLIKEFAADIYGVKPEQVTQNMLNGANAHPLVAQVAKAALKAKNGRGVHNALHAGFEVANVATLKGLGAGGMLLLPWYGMPNMPGLEQMSQNILVGENSALLAYQQLRDAEKGKVQLAQGDVEKSVGIIIASIPGIANEHHGFDNRLVQPMAQALVAQGMGAKQLLQTIANPEKMVALAKTAQEQLDAKAAEAKAVKQSEDAQKPAKFTDKHQPRAHAGSHAAAIEAEHAAAASQTTKRS